MNIGIIGAGMIGGAVAKLAADAGHQVAISNSRGPETLSETVAQLGSNVRATTVEEAARFGDIVVLAIPLFRYTTLPAQQLAGKIVIDAMNYYPNRDGAIDFGQHSTSEYIAAQLPGARVVKAFNTLYYKVLESDGKPGSPLDERIAIFIAGDEPAAKQTVAHLIEESGFAPVDTGSLHTGGKKQEPGTIVYGKPMLYPEAKAAIDGA